MQILVKTLFQDMLHNVAGLFCVVTGLQQVIHVRHELHLRGGLFQIRGAGLQFFVGFQ
jgi:hypothetical protein